MGYVDDKLVAFILIAFAGWRVAYLFVVEDGPFESLARLRQRIGVPREGEIRGFLPRLFSCVYCLSFSTVVGFFFVYLVQPLAVIPFAAWGLATILQRSFGD